jgi:nucleotide-binding universal stress UspA family protein
MYSHILIAIENSDADRAVLEHIKGLARITGARLLLVHVADGWAARNFYELNLRESDEMRQDREYLEHLCAELTAAGFEANAKLALGDPSTELLKAATDEQVDLIAMATHGHRFLADLVHGSTADKVRHGATIPVLLVRRDVAK